MLKGHTKKPVSQQGNSMKGFCMQFEYFCVAETGVLPNGTRFPTCAVQCVCRIQQKAVQTMCFHDVSVDTAFTERLCQLCTEAQVDPHHFLDIVYDLSP